MSLKKTIFFIEALPHRIWSDPNFNNITFIWKWLKRAHKKNVADMSITFWPPSPYHKKCFLWTVVSPPPTTDPSTIAPIRSPVNSEPPISFFDSSHSLLSGLLVYSISVFVSLFYFVNIICIVILIICLKWSLFTQIQLRKLATSLFFSFDCSLQLGQNLK